MQTVPAQCSRLITWLFVLSLVAVPLIASGCYSTRWTNFDATMKQEIGVKNKDYYITEWGPPSSRASLDDGGEVLTWEWQGYVADQYGGHDRGWKKTLIFSREGVLKDYNWQYWGMPLIAL